MKKLTIALLLALTVGCERHMTLTPLKTQSPQTLAVPKSGAYTGAYIDFGDNEDDVTLDKIEAFEKLVGKHQAIVASSSYWGEQSFPTANIQLIVRHQSIPLIFWSPWDKPYDQDIIAKTGPDRFNLNAINEGKWDAYIDAWGDAAKKIGAPMLVSFGNEMNGSWFPWSGMFYGGEKALPNATPDRHPTPIPGYADSAVAPALPPSGPDTYKRAFRHVVDRVRARGANNVLWVFHVNNYSMPSDLWNVAAQYYPGSDYVDWLGLSVYGEQFHGSDSFVDFAPIFEWPADEIHAIDPNKPVMLAEWGVGEFPKEGDKSDWIRDGFAAMQKKTFVKAAIFWHERWQNADDSYSNLRVNSSPEALDAYRKGVSDSYWLDRPVLVPR